MFAVIRGLTSWPQNIKNIKVILTYAVRKHAYLVSTVPDLEPTLRLTLGTKTKARRDSGCSAGYKPPASARDNSSSDSGAYGPLEAQSAVSRKQIILTGPRDPPSNVLIASAPVRARIAHLLRAAGVHGRTVEDRQRRRKKNEKQKTDQDANEHGKKF